MRWIWTLAIACIIAATGVRPELEVRADHSGQLDRATSTTLQHLTDRGQTPQVASRLHASGARDLRDPSPATLATAVNLSAPSASYVLTSTWFVHASISHVVSAHSARGPPVG